MYILKQLIFSILVNSGFRNIYLAAFAARLICSHYSPRFQRIIIVNSLLHVNGTVVSIKTKSSPTSITFPRWLGCLEYNCELAYCIIGLGYCKELLDLLTPVQPLTLV